MEKSAPLSLPATHLAAMLRCPSVTPDTAGTLDYLVSALEPIGFRCDRLVFSDVGTADVDNLYARLGGDGPHLMFAGHTDVVPAGDEAQWTMPPFGAGVKDGTLYGRGAVDMKGGIACFLAAVETYIARHGSPAGSISFLITGDEEGPSVNGTDKLLQWAAGGGERWDAAIVGEPANQQAIGDTIKNGRRGSLSGRITVNGMQGHSAYPHLADNPVRGLVDLIDALLATPFDGGTPHFQPTNMEITTVDVGNPAVNVIPGKAVAGFNIRFNDTWDGETLKAEILRRLEAGARAARIRQGREQPVDFDVEWIGRVSPVFLTGQTDFVAGLSRAIRAVTGRTPEFSTGGGTSDARFIKDYCPVVEFGLVGRTMHQVDERVALADLDTLTAIYLAFLEDWFSANA
ncbi:MAG: succinyl-diaminopimelate desuccinylase [Nitratireductor sp.]|nr:succinyl-diaminopimelate desuccinylase [Nitratireductor sp.]